METRERAVAEIYIDDKSAYDALNGLIKKGNELKEKLIQAAKLGDVDSYKKHQKELKDTEKEAAKLRKSFVSVDQVLKNIKSAPIRDLQMAAKKLEVEMKTLNRDSEEYKKKLQEILRLKREIASVSTSGGGGSGYDSKGNTLNEGPDMFWSNFGANVASQAISTLTSAVKDYIASSWDAYVQAEKNERMLTQAMQGREGVADRLLEKADEWSMAFAIDDDVIIQEQTYLAQLRLTEDQINQIIPAAKGLSNVTGKDLHTSIETLAKSLEGKVTKELKGLDVAFQNITEEGARNGDVINKVANLYGEFADDEAKTLNGQLTNIDTMFENVKESTGEMFARWMENMGIIDGVSERLERMNKIMDLMNKVAEDDRFSSWSVFTGAAQAQIYAEEQLLKKTASDIQKLRDQGFDEEKLKLYFKTQTAVDKYSETIERLNERMGTNISYNWLAAKSLESYQKLLDSESAEKDIIEKEKQHELEEQRKQAAEEYAKQAAKDREKLNELIKKYEKDLIDDKLTLLHMQYQEEIKMIDDLKVSLEEKERAKEALRASYRQKEEDLLMDPLSAADPLINQQMENEEQLNEFIKEKMNERVAYNEFANEQMEKDDQLSLENRKAINQLYADSIFESIDFVSQFYEQSKQRELKAAGDNEARKQQIEREYFKRQQRLNIAEIMIKGALEVAQINANPVVTADLTQTLRTIMTIAAIGRTAAQIALVAGQSYARGKYPVTAQDGRTYSAEYSGPVRTGYYSTPTVGLFAEKEPEIVVDGATTRSLMLRKPWVIQEIMSSRVPNFASGKYTAVTNPSSAAAPSISLTETNELLRMMIAQLSQPTRAKIVWDDILNTEATHEKITGRVSR